MQKSMKSSGIPLENATSSSYYSQKYLPENALDNKSKTTFISETSKIGEYWTAKFRGGQSFQVKSVRIMNRQDCCNERLEGAKIEIGGTYCGTVSAEDASLSGE